MSSHFRSNFDARMKDRRQTLARFAERKAKVDIRNEQQKMEREEYRGMSLLAQDIKREVR